MRIWRELVEGPEWASSCAATGLTPERFDEVARFAQSLISAFPREFSEPFLTDDHRVLDEVVVRPEGLVLHIYFRVEPSDQDCTLLWVESHGA